MFDAISQAKCLLIAIHSHRLLPVMTDRKYTLSKVNDPITRFCLIKAIRLYRAI